MSSVQGPNKVHTETSTREFPQAVGAGLKRALSVFTAMAMSLAPVPSTFASSKDDSTVKVSAEQKAATGPSKSMRTLWVLPLQVDGVVPTRVKERYESSAVDALKSQQFQTRNATGCQDVACALALDPSAKRPVVLRQVLTAKERNYSLYAELIDGPTGRVLATSKESCELCGVREVTELFVARASVIKDKVESTDAFGSTLVVNSDPEGAEIFVDGQMMGRTPAALRLAPGPHKVELRKKGHTPSRKAVTMVNGVKETLDFELSKIILAPVGDPFVDRRPRAISMEGWGWLGIGVGTLGVAAGTTLLVLHKKPFTFRCEEATQDRDENGNCRYLYDTKGGGLTTLSIGGAILATGITLTVLARQKAKRKKRKLALEPTFDGLKLRF